MENITITNFVERHLTSKELEIIGTCKMYELKENEYFIRFGKDKNLYKMFKNSRNVAICINLVGEKIFLSNTAEIVRKIKINNAI